MATPPQPRPQHISLDALLLYLYLPQSTEPNILSFEYHIGPRVYGKFANGRVEEYFNSEALYHQDLLNPKLSRWIAICMAELHQASRRPC